MIKQTLPRNYPFLRITISPVFRGDGISKQLAEAILVEVKQIRYAVMLFVERGL